jgi:hypothetical protein
MNAMKQTIFATTILLITIVSAFNANARQVVTANENYTISTDASIDLSVNSSKSWVIEYGEKQIQVYKHETKKGEEYIVRNEYFEVMYVNDSKGFGVREIKNKHAKVAYQINSAVICTKQMEQQEILSPKKLDEEKALNYIASFVPFLLNENYKHILN